MTSRGAAEGHAWPPGLHPLPARAAERAARLVLGEAG